MVLSFAPLSSSSEVKYVNYSFRTWSVKEGGHPSNPYLLFHQKICRKRGKRKKQMPRILRFLHKFWTSKTTSVQFILQMSYVIINLIIILVQKSSITIITITMVHWKTQQVSSTLQHALVSMLVTSVTTAAGDVAIINQLNMSHLLLLGKFEYTGGPIFKVVLEC